MSAQQPVTVQAQPIDFGSFLRPTLITAISTCVRQYLRQQEQQNAAVNPQALAQSVDQTLNQKLQEILGVDGDFWNTLHSNPKVRDKFATLSLQDQQVQSMIVLLRHHYDDLPQQIARSIAQVFQGPLTPDWQKQHQAIQQMIERHLKAKDAMTLQQCNDQLNVILEQAGVKDANDKEAAKKALFDAVAQRRAQIDADTNNLNQFERQKQKTADEENAKKEKAQTQQPQQQQAGEAQTSDFDSWMQQRKYQGQNLVVSMVLSLILSKGPLNIIDYIGCILTGGCDGLLRKWQMLEYQGMAFDQKLASEELDPFYSGGSNSPRSQQAGDVQGGATAAQAATAQAAQQSNAAQAAANRPKPQGGAQ
jgi:hypothetical protein